jgi:flagellar biosynthesis protein FlhG
MSRSIGRPRGLTIAITSGKGGVGKTSLAINLAVSLAGLGHRVGLLDADLGLGNVDVMLGLTPGAHLGAVLSGERKLSDIAIDGPAGVRVIPAGSGIRAMTALTPMLRQRLFDLMDTARAELDFLLVDTAPGIWDNVLDLAERADRVVVMTSYEPTAIVDAYAVAKLLNAAAPGRELGIVVNAARHAADGQSVFHQLDTAARRFLKRDLRYYGCIVHDPNVGSAALEQRPVVTQSPNSPASQCFRRLAIRVAGWVPDRPVTAAEFERMEAPRCA